MHNVVKPVHVGCENPECKFPGRHFDRVVFDWFREPAMDSVRTEHKTFHASQEEDKPCTGKCVIRVNMPDGPFTFAANKRGAWF